MGMALCCAQAASQQVSCTSRVWRVPYPVCQAQARAASLSAAQPACVRCLRPSAVPRSAPRQASLQLCISHNTACLQVGTLEPRARLSEEVRRTHTRRRTRASVQAARTGWVAAFWRRFYLQCTYNVVHLRRPLTCTSHPLPSPLDVYIAPTAPPGAASRQPSIQGAHASALTEWALSRRECAVCVFRAHTSRRVLGFARYKENDTSA
jgi:hypothetical protein